MYNIKLLNKISKVGLDGFDENQREIFKDCVSKALVNIKKVL